LNIQKRQNYLNRTFNGWGSCQTAMVEKSKAIGRYALAGCADIARECQDKFTKIDNISPHHYLYIDDKTYGAISRYSYGRSMSKFRLWKTFPEILSNIEAFLNKENLKFDKAEAFKKKISPIIKI